MVAAAQQVTEGGRYLTFRVADEAYAIDALRVREVLPFGTATKVPKAPPWIRGVVLLRGRVVPVVDLAAKLGLADTTSTPTTCVVVVEALLETEPVVMGVMVDAVSQVVEPGADDILPPPRLGTRIRVEYLRGLAKTGNALCLLLDLDKVLSADEILAMADFATVVQRASAETAPSAARA
jgi:purine-binding chemotaxis protein CheW